MRFASNAMPVLDDTEIWSPEEELARLKGALRQFMSEQQIQMLITGKHPYKWNEESVNNAMHLRRLTSVKGYQYLISKGWPLPSNVTLSERQARLQIKEGFLDVIFEESLESLRDVGHNIESLEAVLVIDETAIKPQVTVDPKTGNFKGYVSQHLVAERSDVVADHAFVVMLRFTKIKWKIVVAYYFTAKSLDVSMLKQELLQVMQKIESKGIKILGIVSDMGPSNQSLWRELGFSAESSNLRATIPHPLEPRRTLAIFPDPTHLIKNLRAGWEKNAIHLPDDYVKIVGLKTNVVNYEVVKNVIRIQEKEPLKLIPKLDMRKVSPTGLQCMRVGPAVSTLSDLMGESIRAVAHLPEGMKYPDREVARSTSKFIHHWAKWWKVVTKRSGKPSNDDLKFLEANAIFVMDLKVQGKGGIRPWQRGIAIFDLAVVAMKDNEFFTCDLLSDCLESFFGQAKYLSAPHPTAT